MLYSRVSTKVAGCKDRPSHTSIASPNACNPSKYSPVRHKLVPCDAYACAQDRRSIVCPCSCSFLYRSKDFSEYCLAWRRCCSSCSDIGSGIDAWTLLRRCADLCRKREPWRRSRSHEDSRQRRHVRMRIQARTQNVGKLKTRPFDRLDKHLVDENVPKLDGREFC